MTTENTTDGACPASADIEGVLRELTAVRADMVAGAAMSQPGLDEVHSNFRDSARNLLHYLALRRRDLRPLQLRLAAMGLSSLGRAESHVLATVDAVLGVLHLLANRAWQPPSQEAAVVDFANGQRLLAEHTHTLLGSVPAGREVRIMVTMPSEAADDYLLVHDLNMGGSGWDAGSCSVPHSHRLRRSDWVDPMGCAIAPPFWHTTHPHVATLETVHARILHLRRAITSRRPVLP